MARTNEFASYLADVQKQTIASVKAAQDLTLRGFELATGSTTKAPSPASVIEAGFALVGQTLAYQKAWALTLAGAAEKSPAGA
jgi:hypothetical protein